jgi:hypothetical protein
MKPIVGIVLLSVLSSCAPVTQAVTSVLPGRLSIEETRPNQGDSACSPVRYTFRNGGTQSIKVDDRFSFEFKPVDTVTLAARARNGVIVFCTDTTIATIPGWYETTARGTVNDVTFEGDWRFFVAGEFLDLVEFDVPRPAVVPVGGRLCIDARARPDRRSEYSVVPAAQLELRFVMQGKLEGAVAADGKPICVSAPSGTLPGEYRVGVTGRVKGIGVNRGFSVTVR